MSRGWWRLGLMASVVAAGLAMACSSDDGASEEEQQALIDTALRVASVDGTAGDQAELDFYAAHVGPGFVQTFGFDTVDACMAAAADCVGTPLTNATVDPESVEIDGDSAELVISAEEGAFGLDAEREGEDADWRLVGFFPVDDEVPDGVETVAIELQDFAFVFDASDEALASGTFAFEAKNAGEQPHEIAVVKLPEGMPLMDALTSEDESAIEFIGVKFPFAPDDEAHFLLEGLTAGNYGLVCFLPDTSDPEGTPHAFKGMVAEFTVQ